MGEDMINHHFTYTLPVKDDLSELRTDIAEYVGEAAVDHVVNLVNQVNTGVDPRPASRPTKVKIERLRKILPQVEEAANILIDDSVRDALMEAGYEDETLKVRRESLKNIHSYLLSRDFRTDIQVLAKMASQAKTSGGARPPKRIDWYFLDELAVLILKHNKGSLRAHDYKGGGEVPNYLQRLVKILPVTVSGSTLDKAIAKYKNTNK